MKFRVCYEYNKIVDVSDDQVQEHIDCPDCERVDAKPVVYVAHPVSGAPIDNCYRTVRWLKFLIDHDPTRIYIAPWVGEVLGFPGTEGEDDHRPWTSALGDDVQVLARCDEIILVGGKISQGMQVELDAARKLMLRITDLSQYRTPKDLPDGFFLDPASES